MKCHEIEELLPRYCDGDCAETDRREIERHVASCQRCRESLESFEAIERSLIDLRGAVPSWKRAEARFIERTGAGRARSVAALLFNAPVAAGLAFVVCGLVLLGRGRLLSSGIELVGERLANWLDSFSRYLSQVLSAMGGFEVAALLSVCVIVTAFPLVAFGLAVQRFGRR
jgi:hypothetical protein